jgi:hypothetical protein
MNAKTLKSRLGKVKRLVAQWRSVLRIDPKWEVELIAELEEDEEAWASLDVDIAEYWKVKLLVHKRLMDLGESAFAEKSDQVVLHEMLHLLIWQYTSFAQNVGGAKLRPEMAKLEEQVVQQLECIIWNLVDSNRRNVENESQGRGKGERVRRGGNLDRNRGRAACGVPDSECCTGQAAADCGAEEVAGD